MTKQIRLWYLYDFANSFASVVLIFYFPLIFVEKGGMEEWIGVAASLSTVLLLVLLPPLGRRADQTGRRLPLLSFGLAGMAVSLGALAFIFESESLSSQTVQIVALLVYIFFQFCFQGSVAVYSSLLRALSDRDNDVAVSGRGYALGQLGNAVAMAMVSPLVASGAIFLGLSGKPLALLVGAGLSVVLGLPFLLLAKEVGGKKQELVAFSYVDFWRKIKNNKPVLLFLLGMLCLSDAISTFEIYATVYLSKVFDLTDQLVIYTALVGLGFGLVGGLIAFRLVLLLRSKMNTLLISSALYGLCFFLLAVVPKSHVLVFGVLVLSGLSYGLVFSLARVIYAELVPPDEQTEYFSMYGLFQRASVVVGPLVWVAIFTLLAPFGEDVQYRGSIFFLVFIVIIGYGFLRKVKYVQTYN
jgi:UMF1 family MFS transporter